MKLRFHVLAGLVLLGLAGPRANAADDYPTRQIKIIVPFPAGAGPDQVARLIGQRLQDELGQTVVIENRSGALGSLGAQEVARSAPDGYTLLMGTNTTQASNVAMLKNLPYDPARDFAPIIRTITTAMVLLVKPDFPAKDLEQFMEYAKTHPNMTAGYGSGASQISNAQLQSRGGMTIISASYRGVPLAVTDVISGVIDLAFADFSVAIPQMQGGTLRGIGVTSPKRNELTPDLPALAEAMPGFEATIWYGLLAPANTPEPIVNRLYTSTRKSCRRRPCGKGLQASAWSFPRCHRLNSAPSSAAKSCGGRRMPRPPASKQNSRAMAVAHDSGHAGRDRRTGSDGHRAVRAADRCEDTPGRLRYRPGQMRDVQSHRRHGGDISARTRRGSRTIIVAVYSGEQVEALFGEIDDGAGAARPVVICITTCGPGEIIGIAERASRAGLPLLEAPISGTSIEVRTAPPRHCWPATTPSSTRSADSRIFSARAACASARSAMPAGPNSRSI